MSAQDIRRGARLGLISQTLNQAVSLAATLVLARLLAPRDIGLVSLAQSVVALTSIGMAWGFGTAMIRRGQLTRSHVDGAFCASVLAGAVLTLVGLAFAGILGSTARDPRSGAVIAALSPTMLLQAAATVPAGLLQRRLQFRRLYTAQTSGVVVYIGIELALAWAGWGPWAIIVGLIANPLVALIFALVFSRLSVRVVNPLPWLWEERHLAGGTMSIQGVSAAAKNVDYWIIGIALGSGPLGLYYMAYVLPGILRFRLTAVLNTVLMPVFARSELGSRELAAAYRRSTLLQLAAGIPTMTGLAVAAELVVRASLGSRWLGAVPVLRVIALTMILELLANAPHRVAIVHGRFRPILACELTGVAVLSVCALVATETGQGIVGVAVAVLCARVVSTSLSLAFVARPMGLHPWLLRADLTRCAGAAMLMGLGLVGLLQWLESSDLPAGVQLFISAPAGAVLYLGVGRVLFPGTFRRLLVEARLLLAGR